MKTTFARSLVAGLMIASMASATTVWNPAANPDQTAPFDWNDTDNWTNGVPQDTGTDEFGKAVFNVPDAAEAEVTDAQVFHTMSMGDNNVGGVVRIKNGGSITTGETWSAVGYNDEANLVIEAGGTATFGQHLWVGLLEGLGGEKPTVDVDGGTLNVSAVLGLNWDTDGFGSAIGEDSVVNVINNGVANIEGRLDLGRRGGLGTVNINSGGVVNAAHLINGGTIVVGDGGQLVTPAGQWASVGQRDNGATSVLTVEEGGSVSFGEHLWVGFENPNAVGEVNINGGAVSVAAMLGLGWDGANPATEGSGTGTINVNDGGVLDLFQLHADGESSIELGSELHINGTGQVTIPGNYTAVLTDYINNGRIFANGTTNDVNAFSIEITTVGGGDGDYNDDGNIDAADYTVWRDNLGTTTELPNDPIGGTIGAAQYDQWRENYGGGGEEITILTALPLSLSAASSAPEPGAMMILLLSGVLALSATRQKR